MPSLPYATASVREMPRTPAFAAAYCVLSQHRCSTYSPVFLTPPTRGWDTRPKIDEILTIAPRWAGVPDLLCQHHPVFQQFKKLTLDSASSLASRTAVVRLVHKATRLSDRYFALGHRTQLLTHAFSAWAFPIRLHC
jgi:hypothetical protein